MRIRYGLDDRGELRDRHGKPIPPEVQAKVVGVTLDLDIPPQPHPQADIPNNRWLPGDAERWNPRSKRKGLRT